MNDFGQLMNHPNASLYNRCDGSFGTLKDALYYCIEPESNGDDDDEYYYHSSYGGLFYEVDSTEKFTNIEDFMKAARYIDIGDMIHRFRFGHGNHSNSILIDKGGMGEAGNSFLKQFWFPTIHYKWGICYSFEPKNHGLGMIPALVKGQFSIEQTLNDLEIVFQVHYVHTTYVHIN